VEKLCSILEIEIYILDASQAIFWDSHADPVAVRPCRFVAAMWGTVHTKFGAQMLFTGLPKELRDGIQPGRINIGILAGSNPSLLKKLEINRVQDQLVGKNKADLSDFMGKGVVEDEDNGFKDLKKLRYIWGDADGFKWALVSILVATEWEGKYPRASPGLGRKKKEIIAKLDDLDKRAEVVLGIKERRKNRIFQMTDGARMESPFKAYDKVKFFKGAIYSIISDRKGGPRVNEVFISLMIFPLSKNRKRRKSEKHIHLHLKFMTGVSIQRGNMFNLFT
ncbi:hypothetical protein ACJX0J_027430, partial [Zea mays]